MAHVCSHLLLLRPLRLHSSACHRHMRCPAGEQLVRPLSFAPVQKSRVALARVTWTRPHILLLDEPSNHLDIDAVEALIQARCCQ